MAGYMTQLLEELGWNQGTRIPLADDCNKKLESLLIARQDEIQRLREATSLQAQKSADLNKYKHYVATEYQENTKLLLAQKQQLEQEYKVMENSKRDAANLERDMSQMGKRIEDMAVRTDRVQNDIARLLRKADGLKSEVCGDRGVLEEWRAALDRSACDIEAIERFNKQDTSKAKELETKRQKLKVEHDRTRDKLTQLCSNLAAEERACERISKQVEEASEQRRRITMTWAGAVDNLRQRDKDIRHTKEEYSLLEAEASRLAEQCREKQQFLDQQVTNNAEGERENALLSQRLSRLRMSFAQLHERNKTLDSSVKTLQQELSKMKDLLQQLYSENKQIMEEQHRKDQALKLLNNKLTELKEKKIQSQDKTKSSQVRAKELQDMLNEEEKYASNLTVNQQRGMHCSFTEQQKLAALKNEEKLYHMAIKSCRTTLSKLDTKQQTIERELLAQKESIYHISYQVETIGARVAAMEGASVERECNAELVAREKRLQEVCGIHAARVALLSAHSDKLRDEMRRLTRDIALHSEELEDLQSRLKSRMLSVEGGEKEVRGIREAWRRARVEESLLKLRVAHSSRAVANLDNVAFTLDMQRLQVDAAMNERQVEIDARSEMFSVQKRALNEDCGKLRFDIRERFQRIEQLKKRYDIFISSLGKDDSGEQLSVTFFKIKFAAERAELRARGAELDADIERSERDVLALESTLKVMHAAHSHFMHHISPLSDDDIEMQKLRALGDEYYHLHDALQKLNPRLEEQQQRVTTLTEEYTLISDKHKQLKIKEAEVENEWENARERLARQESRLDSTRETVRAHARRARKLLNDITQWQLFHMEMRNRNYAEATYSALRNLVDICCVSPEAAERLAELAQNADLANKLNKQHKRCHAYLQRLLLGRQINEGVIVEGVSSVSLASEGSRSSTGRASIPDAYGKRLSAFRKSIARKLNEPMLTEDDLGPRSSRSSISLSVVTLGLDQEPVRDVTTAMRLQKH